MMFLHKKRQAYSKGMVAFADGELIALENVSDPVFSEKMMGNGVAIIPKREHIVSPCKGTITMLYPTLHAFGIHCEEGLDILVHIGIDTVRLKGRGFIQHVQLGDIVHANDKIISFDAKYLKDQTLDFTTMLLFPDCTMPLQIKTKGHVRKGKDIVVTMADHHEKRRKI